MQETLNRAHNVNEKLAWGDQVVVGEFEDEEFHTHVRSPMNDHTIVTPQPSPKVHLEVDSHVYFAIVKELIELNVTSSQPSTKTPSNKKVKGSRRPMLPKKVVQFQSCDKKIESSKLKSS